MRRRRTLITGAHGQLSRALQRLLVDVDDVVTFGRPDVDLTNWKSVRDGIAAIHPHLIIHAAALTDVDGCERDPELAWNVNAVATRYVAHAGASVGARLVYVSTNYVFDGGKSSPYHEFDSLNPISVYGASKLAGEREAQAAMPTCQVARTAWLYSPEGRNFMVTMRRLMAERDHISVVSDQRGNPTSADDLAAGILKIADDAPAGVYHLANSGDASWFEWASEIARLTAADVAIDPIAAADYPRAATPPTNGVLTSLMLPALGIEMQNWKDALRKTICPA